MLYSVIYYVKLHYSAVPIKAANIVYLPIIEDNSFVRISSTNVGGIGIALQMINGSGPGSHLDVLAGAI
jgi:hypothetical protein